MPEASPLFWVVKLLVAAGGVATSDYLLLGSHAVAAVVEAGLILVGLVWQLRVRRYTAPAYWFLVYAIVICGTGLSDALHLAAGLPYAVTTLLWAAVLAGAVAAWYRDPEFSVHSIMAHRREALYWALVFASFALGSALADLAAASLNLGYGSSAVVFAAAAAIPAIDWCLGRTPATAFWWAYMLTWPLGTSVADYVSKAPSGSGLGFGDGRTALAGGLAVAIALVGKAASAELHR